MSNSVSPIKNMDDCLEGTEEEVQGAKTDPVDDALTVAKTMADSLDSQLDSVQDTSSVSDADPAPITKSHSRRSRTALDKEATVVFNSYTQFVNDSESNSLIPTRPNTPIKLENPRLNRGLRREGAIILNSLENRVDKA